MHRNQSVSTHAFSMVPRSDIPRSSFRMQKTVKTNFNSGFLIPVLCEEVLPGDTFNCRMTAFCRLATPLFPFLDNMYLDSFFFFVPNRLVWTNWQRFMGEQDSPADSIAYTIPQMTSPVGGYIVNGIHDQFGLPTVGQVGGGNTIVHSALPLRAYNLVYDKWFRDENLCNATSIALGDGPDNPASYVLLRRGKRHDYFTACLPWVQKGSTSITLPLTGNALVKTSAGAGVTGVQQALQVLLSASGGNPTAKTLTTSSGGGGTVGETATAGTSISGIYPSNLYADLSTATATTINQMRLSFQTQKLLERDARGGTRYTEIVRSHFGVVSPDARLQRPEYLGGGTTMVSINPVAQTSATGLTGGTSPQANLSAFGTALARGHGFSQSFTEHGHILGIVNVRADLTYQQGLRKFWKRLTRYDFYFPAFAMLGEQAVLNQEIFADGSANDALVFGFQERWSELRYNPSEIRGLFKSTAAGTLDAWHLAQKFVGVPTLNATFIGDFPPVARVIAVPSAPEFLADFFFDMKVARPLPMYSVPGLIDHF